MTGINKFLNLIIILGCAVFAFFFYQYKTKKELAAHAEKIEQSSIKPNLDPQELANKYLQEAQRNLTNEKLKASLNMKKAVAGSVNDNRKQPEVDPSQIPVDQQIWKDGQAKTPEQRFSEQLQRNQYNQMNNSQSEIEKQEYIRQFKENARKNGYEITVNDDLEVTNVTPIRKPQNQKNDYDSNQNGESEF